MISGYNTQTARTRTSESDGSLGAGNGTVPLMGEKYLTNFMKQRLVDKLIVRPLLKKL
jgi:hypothetical protein